MHDERAALLGGMKQNVTARIRGLKIGKSAEEWHFTLRERLL
jgi:hypothetical protein